MCWLFCVSIKFEPLYYIATVRRGCNLQSSLHNWNCFMILLFHDIFLLVISTFVPLSFFLIGKIILLEGKNTFMCIKNAHGGKRDYIKNEKKE